MPSYTFNSNTSVGRHPSHLDGGRFVLAVLVLLLLAGGGLELLWRSRGYHPVASDTANLWGLHVDKVSKLNSDALVIVGSSRVQLGLDPAVLKENHGFSEVVQLARAAGSPVPVLEYIVNQTDYRGTVLCGITPGVVFDELQRQRKPLEAALAQRENRPFYAPLEERLIYRIQSVLCLNNTTLSWKLAGNGLVRGNWPNKTYAAFHPSRYIAADYSRCDELDSLLDGFADMVASGAPMKDGSLKKLVNHVAALADRLEKRGGKLVLIRMPSYGKVYEVECREYPKEKYWAAFKQRFGDRAIHFTDLETAMGTPFECPDGSHLDYRDAERISKELGRWIK
ncbi:hypothetical protein [Pontiella agarivorans]|uniref:SGNH hydrolase-type esterase domain-containing protein n=1 Tax=Pontiella agarivorans TaxID=3038953 RepID=A0ABU5MU52_9BACT|nr:hypothetical protein [Pontiella agarivorans]MDZ8117740.1 hypothetical protein [Pontiella agarivorans]